MNKLLKDAIADAKAVRETALANAKAALEEAFAPKLQSMLSHKIKEEMQDESTEEEYKDEEPIMKSSEIGKMEIAKMKKHAGLMSEKDEDMEDSEDMDSDEDMDMDSDEDMDMDSDEDMEDGEEEAPHHKRHKYSDEEDSDEEVSDEDLDEILAELEAEEDHDVENPTDADRAWGKGNYQGKPDKVAEDHDVENPTDADRAWGKGNYQGKPDTVESYEEESVDRNAKNYRADQDTTSENEDPEAKEMDEEIDLEEIIAALKEEHEMEDETKMEDESKMEDETKMEEVTSQLHEALSVVKYLRSKLNEVNLLNAKLLYVNKLFRKGELSESQKVKIIETFDRAKTVREAKLIFATISESMNAKSTVGTSKKKLSEGYASAPQKSTRVITESNNVFDRFKTLVNYNHNS